MMLIALLAAAMALPPAETVSFVPVARETVEARLRQLVTKNEERRANLAKLFQEAGCNGEQLSEQPVKGSREGNVICTLSGTGEGTILVGAHFDQTGAGKGAADNWSGASLLPTLFESLRDRPRRHTFVFIGFTDEEIGLKGSSFYARKLTKEEKAKVRAMVNLDTLGLSSTKFWASRSDPALMTALLRVALAMKLPAQGVNFEQIGSTDSESFRTRKIPSITIHSVTQETLSVLHSAHDTLDAVRLDDYYDTYRLIAAYLAYLDALDALNAAPAADAGQRSSSSPR